MDVRDLRGRTALVTGAASGIGRETALLLGRRGANLAICDRDEEGLADTVRQLEAMGREVIARCVDVASREEMRSFADAVHTHVPALDLLVNNAGVGLIASFRDTSLEDWDWIVGINLMGVVHGCHYFVPAMVERGAGGHVVNVSSTAGYTATETLCAYSTTKFGVLGLSECLRQELHRYGIGVTAICPGVINTAITNTAPMRGDFAKPGARDQMVELYDRRNYGPERVAENILKAVQRDRTVAPISLEAWVFYYLKRLAPGFLSWGSRGLTARQRRQIEARSRAD